MYYGEQHDEAHLPFNFQLVLLSAWNAQAIREAVETYQAALPVGAWPNWGLGNPDVPRIATPVGREQARGSHMLLPPPRGNPTLHYGHEFRMQGVTIPPH